METVNHITTKIVEDFALQNVTHDHHYNQKTLQSINIPVSAFHPNCKVTIFCQYTKSKI